MKTTSRRRGERQHTRRGRLSLLLTLLAGIAAALALSGGSASAASAATIKAFDLGSSWTSLASASAATQPAGWQTPGFDDSSWTASRAPFSSTVGVSAGCGFPAGASVFPINGQVLARKHVTLPAGATQLRIRGTVDNSATIYVNGVPVGGSSTGNCTTDTVDVTVPDSALAGGDNVVAVRAVDTGSITFLDLQAEYAYAGGTGSWTGYGSGITAGGGDGTATSPAFLSYNHDLGISGGVSGAWSLETTATADATVQLDWHWTGLHAWFMVTAGLEAFVIHGDNPTVTTSLVDAGPQSCCTTPSNGFDYSGTTTLTVHEGDTYGFRLRGSNGDYNSFLRGILSATATVTPTGPPPAPPTILRVVPNGSFTTVVGRVEGGAATADLTFVGGTTCAKGVLGGTQSTIGIVSVPLDANGYFIVGVGNVPVLSYVAARWTGGEGDESSAPLSPCVVARAGNDTWPTALSLDTGLATDDVVDQPGQSRWYSFSVQPGSKVTVRLSGLPADYTLSLFKDISQAYTTLTSPADLTRLSAEYAPSVFSPSVFSPSVFSPSVFSPDAYAPSVFSPSVFSPSVFSPSVFSPSVFSPSVFSPSVFSPSVFSPSVFSPSVFSPSVFSPSVFSPSVFSPDAFASAQTRSLVAVAAEPGAADKTVTANTWSNTGRYYVRVTGRDGAFAPDGAFHVAVTRGASGCGTGVTGIGSAPATQPGRGIKTVILTDPSRIAGTAAQKATLAGRLASLAARPEVAGVVVDLSADPRIGALNAQADANTACPYAKNLVASAIKDVVDSYRANNPLQYVTIVGGDDVVPFFRYPDESLLGQESGYVPPVGSTTASEASLRLDYVLGQDAYGARTAISLRSNSFPVPDLAVGRLVETASEATGMIDAYVATGGVVTPRSSLVSGYDFLADAAGAVQADLVAGTAGPGAVNDALIAPNNISPQDPAAWTAPQLKSKLLGSQRHDLVFLAGHFSANSALAADFSTSLLTTDLAAAATSFQNTIVFSAGCHSGYNIVDGHAVPGVTLTLDWAQAFAQKGATLVAGTGYQYGDTDFLEYSERIYAGLARQLRYGSGPVTIGEALVRSKQDYLETTPDIRGIHEKALLESTVFGLPMLSVNLPSGRLAVPGGASAVTSLTPAAADPGLSLGLSSTLLTVTPDLVPHTVALANLGGGSLTATYYSGRNGVATNPAEPALPLEQVDVTPPSSSLVLRGVGFRGGSYTDETVVPLTGAPTTELRGVHVPFVSPVFFPMRLSTVNYYDALAGGQGGRTGLLVTPAQHRAASLAAGTSTLRRYGSVQLQLFYSGYLGSAALSAAPDISGVTATVLADPPGEIAFQARVVGDPAAGVHQVWVTYTGDGPSRWASLDLTQDAVDSSLWTGRLSGIAHPESLQFMVQAANGLGLVSLDDALGAYHRVAAAGGSGTPAAPADTTLALVSPPASGVFGGTATVTARLSSLGTPVAGRTVSLAIGGAGRSGTTAADGTVTVSIPLSALPGDTSVTAAFGGDDAYAAAGASAPFALAKAPAALSPLTAQLPLVFAPGDTGVSTTLTAAIGGASQPLLQQTVTFTLTGPAARTFSAITDYLGRVSLPSAGLAPGTYAVTAAFAGDATYLGATATGQLTVTLSRQQVLDAVTAERAMASRRDRPDLRAAQRALADSLLPGTWIDELHLVVKRHGDRVFNDDIEALQQFRELLRDRKSGVADAKVQSWIDALTRIDRRIAELAMSEATAAGGNARKLADAAKELARGNALLLQGKFAGAVQQFAEAWDDAKDSLVKPGKKSERESDRDRGRDDDFDR